MEMALVALGSGAFSMLASSLPMLQERGRGGGGEAGRGVKSGRVEASVVS
jgi:hypothetical protein